MLLYDMCSSVLILLSYMTCVLTVSIHRWVRAHFETSREAILGLNLNPKPKSYTRTSRSYTRSWAARRTWSATRKTHKFSESRLKHKLSERSTPNNFCTENHSFRGCYWEYCSCNSGSCFMTLSLYTHTHMCIRVYKRISPILLFYYFTTPN